MGIFGIIIIAASYWGITFLRGLDILASTDTFSTFPPKFLPPSPPTIAFFSLLHETEASSLGHFS